MAVIEFQNKETEAAFMASIHPTPKRTLPQLPVKISYQKFQNGKAILTVLTRD